MGGMKNGQKCLSCHQHQFWFYCLHLLLYRIPVSYSVFVLSLPETSLLFWSCRCVPFFCSRLILRISTYSQENSRAENCFLFRFYSPFTTSKVYVQIGIKKVRNKLITGMREYSEERKKEWPRNRLTEWRNCRHSKRRCT